MYHFSRHVENITAVDLTEEMLRHNHFRRKVKPKEDHVGVRHKTKKVYPKHSMGLQPFLGPWPLFQFLNVYRVGRTPWTVDQPVARPLPTYRTTQTQNKRTQISMP
jgi:hypothetical protein